MRTFYTTPEVEPKLEILRRYDVDYVMVLDGSPLERRIQTMPGIEPVQGAPEERYSLYSVDLEDLDG